MSKGQPRTDFGTYVPGRWPANYLPYLRYVLPDCRGVLAYRCTFPLSYSLGAPLRAPSHLIPSPLAVTCSDCANQTGVKGLFSETEVEKAGESGMAAKAAVVVLLASAASRAYQRAEGTFSNFHSVSTLPTLSTLRIHLGVCPR
jgi:hypothetical protein